MEQLKKLRVVAYFGTMNGYLANVYTSIYYLFLVKKFINATP
ncbi:hypothetical protein ACJDUH_10480 [Clostridium sp. WILCCON 0202]|uniref:Uncharacterized protein n=1 Tax=Candidatus Clostridium radicumherbarum TaxID=3381662 RepID=A0ABW8TT76_9CLOT